MTSRQNLSPIVIFCFRRLHTLVQVIDSLKANELAAASDLIVYSDGYDDILIEKEVIAVRQYLHQISGFKSVRIINSKKKLGLANSIIKGVSEVLSTYKSCIILEDDLVVSSNFLDFMNQGLSYYQNNNQVVSICGYSPLIKSNEDIYFTHRSSSWGWATWSDRWERIDWECKSYQTFKYNLFQNFRFNKMGSDLSWMLWKQMHGQINSWAIRFCFHQFNCGLYSIHPTISKVQNIGVGDLNATNTNGLFSRFETTLDEGEKRDFLFIHDSRLNHDIIKQFVKPNSFIERFKSKFIKYF